MFNYCDLLTSSAITPSKYVLNCMAYKLDIHPLRAADPPVFKALCAYVELYCLLLYFIFISFASFHPTLLVSAFSMAFPSFYLNVTEISAHLVRLSFSMHTRGIRSIFVEYSPPEATPVAADARVIDSK